MSLFFQNGPTFTNPYASDPFLKSLLKRFLSQSDLKAVESDLHRFGVRIVEEIEELGVEAERHPPTHRPFDPWGRRIDHIEISQAWDRLAQISAEEGLVALGYERPYGVHSRLVQFAKLFLFHPSSAYFTCPLAMSDGAAKLIELHGDDELKKKAFVHLTSRDPNEAWTSGQWMTEKTGGSDVSQSETIARLENGQWKLYGIKWFTSAITSQMSMALARIEDQGKTTPGSKGLGLFYIELRNAQGELNNIEVLRLKDKLGTKALPTAELRLNGTVAKLVAPAPNGVKTISSLFNVTRIYNACTSLGAFRRLLNLSRDYAQKRVAFKRPLIEQPLHLQTLAELEVDYAALFQLCFYVVRLQGQDEAGDSHASALLRVLTPITKLYTAKINLAATNELIESFGGAGYIEDTNLPRFLRDAQVLSIWEGTTNVLSLDTLRALFHDKALEGLLQELNKRIEGLQKDDCTQMLAQEYKTFNLELKKFEACVQEDLERHSRELSFSIAKLTSALLLIEQAQWSKEQKDHIFARRFIQRGIVDLKLNPDSQEENLILLKNH